MPHRDDPRPPGLTACGLCAGETLGEGPEGQIGRLRDLAARDLASLHEVECLDQCNRGDVVVVRPCPSGRRRGGRPVWFSGLAGPDRTAELEEWLRAGGPGESVLPAALAPLRIVRDDPEAGLEES
jgi:hypothetical protein